MRKKAKTSKVHLEVTNHCNLHCDAYPINNSRLKPRHMPFSLFTKGVDDIARDSITDTIGFHVLGEPLLYPHLLEALEYAQAKGLRTEVATNGVLLTGERALALNEAGLGQLTISLRIGEAEEAAHRTTKLSQEDYREGIMTAVGAISRRATGTQLVVEAGRSIGEEDSQQRLVLLLSDLSAATGQVTNPDAVRSALEQVNPARSRITRLQIHDRVLVHLVSAAGRGNAFTSRRAHPVRFGVCEYALRNVGVLGNGEVTICLHDYDGHTSLGNLYVSSLGGLLSSSKTDKIRKGFQRMRVVHPYCQSCPLSMHPVKVLLKELGSALICRERRSGLSNPTIQNQRRQRT